MRVHPDNHLEAAGLVVRIAQARDRESFRALYAQCAPRLKGFFLGRGLQDATAEELVQETMLNVWRKAGLFDASRGNFHPWLFAIARNVMIDHLRRSAAERAGVAELEGPGAPATVPPVEDALQVLRDLDVLRAALAELPDEQAQVVRATFFAGSSLRELAEQSGLPLGTVKTRARLAMQRLRQAIFQRGDQ